MGLSENTIYTIGHSNHEIEKFIDLLQKHEIDVVADVRSSPYSRYSSQFNKDILKNALSNHEIKYLYLGSELGARTNDPECYVSGRVSFEKMRKQAAFQKGIERLLIGMQKCKIALMCSEKNPIDCHRSILVSRTLKENGVTVKHILEDGETIDQVEIENQLMKKFKIEPDLFDDNRDILVCDAYKRQEEDISYVIQQEGENVYG